MKKVLVMVGILCCLFFSLSSCGSGDKTSSSDTEESVGAAAGQASEDTGSMKLRIRQRICPTRPKMPRRISRNKALNGGRQV